MHFLVFAALFALAVAEPQDLNPHMTNGYVAYPNGAVTPMDTYSVQAAKAQHLNAKAAATAYKYPFWNVAQPIQHVAPRVQAQPIQHVAPRVQAQPLQYVAPSVQQYHVASPYYQTVVPFAYQQQPFYHQLFKREAEAEPEADSQYHSYANTARYYNPHMYTNTQYYGTPTYQNYYRTPTTYQNYYGTPATTYGNYYGMPSTTTSYSHRLYKREAEPEADSQYFGYAQRSYYNPYNTQAHYYGTPTYQNYYRTPTTYQNYYGTPATSSNYYGMPATSYRYHY